MKSQKKYFNQNILRVFLSISSRKTLGVLLVLSVPVIHNLHNILSKEIVETSIQYHIKVYYFLWIFEHSFAACLGFLGCYLLIQSKIKAVVGVPFGYELYKSLEKLPIRKDYDIHEEYVIISILFCLTWVSIFKLLELVEQNISKK